MTLTPLSAKLLADLPSELPALPPLMGPPPPAPEEEQEREQEQEQEQEEAVAEQSQLPPVEPVEPMEAEAAEPQLAPADGAGAGGGAPAAEEPPHTAEPEDGVQRGRLLARLPDRVLGAVCALQEGQGVRLKACSLEALQRLPPDAAAGVLWQARALAARGRLLNPDGFVVSSCWCDDRDAAGAGTFEGGKAGGGVAALQEDVGSRGWWDWPGARSARVSCSSTSASSHGSTPEPEAPAAGGGGAAGAWRAAEPDSAGVGAASTGGGGTWQAQRREEPGTVPGWQEPVAGPAGAVPAAAGAQPPPPSTPPRATGEGTAASVALDVGAAGGATWRDSRKSGSSGSASWSNDGWADAGAAAGIGASSWATDAARTTGTGNGGATQSWGHEEDGVELPCSTHYRPEAPPVPVRHQRLRLARDDTVEAELQARNLSQEQRDACMCAALLGAKGLLYGILAAAVTGGFAVVAVHSGGNYMVYYFVWAAIALVTGLLVRTRAAFIEAWNYWGNTTRVHIVLRSNDSHAEFKAVGRYLENCGMMCPHLRLRIEQDEDDVEEVRFFYTPWATSFVKQACIYGDSGEPSSIEFRSVCWGRWLPCLPSFCAQRLCCCCGDRPGRPAGPHGHFEVHYQKAGDWGAAGAGGARADSCDTLTFSVQDHHAEAIQNLILKAHRLYTQPRNTKVEVYSATPSGDHPQGGSASWEFIQYISPIAQERTGRFTYVPGEAFAQIEEEYRRVVQIGNESLSVLVTGRSRAGKSAMVTALAHRLSLPIYSLNLKAKFLTDGGIDALFSHRAIPHRPVLVHIEEFSMMFQETVARPATCNLGETSSVSLDASGSSEEPGEAGEATAAAVQPRYEGLQTSSALNCSDLLKLFDQSGTTSPKRIFFVLTCIDLPQQFDQIRELQPLLARGRIQHYRLEEPTEEVIAQYVLQHFHSESRRAVLSAAEREALTRYVAQMKARLGGEFRNWHAVKKYAEVYPLGN